MTNKVTESARRVGAAASETLAKANDAVRSGAASARTKASGAYDATRRGATRAGERVAGGVEQNPLAILVGGAAFGALIGALLPRTDRETRAIGAVGKRIRDTVG